MITDDRFAKIQDTELEYWANTKYCPTIPWKFYDQKFVPFLSHFKAVVDVGCGPVPYFYNGSVVADRYVAIDPLYGEYLKLSRFDSLRYFECEWFDRMSKAWSNCFDGVFALNMLDHVQSPENMVVHLKRILSRDGLLYLYVDLDKKPDAMHPHTITREWLLPALGLETVMLKQEKSWRFENQILWFVGRKV